MISRNFEDYPEHRVGLYKMLQSINSHCFDGISEVIKALLRLPPNQFKLFIDSIIWAIKHSMRDISDMGLEICLDLLTNFSKSVPNISNQFYHQYFIHILQDIFYVWTNSFHSSGKIINPRFPITKFDIDADV